MTKKELAILFTLAAIQFTHILDGMIMMPMAPSIREAFTISTQQFGFVVSSYTIAAAISAIVATFWIDAFDRKKVLLFLYTGFIVGTFACSLAPTYEFLLMARFLTGLFGGVVGAIIMSIVGDVIAPERRAQGMGILMSGFALASIAGIPLGIYLSEEFSWHMPFLLICAIALPVWALILFVVPPVTAHLGQVKQKGDAFAIYRSVFQNKNQLRALLFSFTLIGSHAAIIPFMSDFYVNNLGFDLKTQVIFMYVVGGILSSVSSPLTGRIADRYGRFWTVLVMSILATIPMFVIPNMQTASMFVMLVAGGMYFIFSGGRFIPSIAMITSTVPPQMRGRFMSLNSAIQQMGFGLSVLIGGLILTNDTAGRIQHFPIVGYIGMAMSIVSIVVASTIKGVEAIPEAEKDGRVLSDQGHGG